jgi:hypothetical protein
MIRALNIAFIALTGLVCLGLYRIAEEARVAAADLKATTTAITREHEALVVLGAEWASLTQPARIQALAQRHLDLSDEPRVELSSLTGLPLKNAPLGEASVHDAKAVVPLPETLSVQTSSAALPSSSSSLPPSSTAAVRSGDPSRSDADPTVNGVSPAVKRRFASIHAGT